MARPSASEAPGVGAATVEKVVTSPAPFPAPPPPAPPSKPETREVAAPAVPGKAGQHRVYSGTSHTEFTGRAADAARQGKK